MDSENIADSYDAYYYAHGCGSPYERADEWLRHFDGIAERIVEQLQPQTVLDAGCAMGFLVEMLRRRGVEAYGVDVSEYAIEQVHADARPYCWVGSVAEPFPQTYDLIVCIEVLEHVPHDEAERAVANFCRHARSVLFSSSPFDYKEPTHFNVQAPEYWAAIFAQHGFYRDVDYDASYIAPWAVRFIPKQEPTHRLIRDYERRFWLLWKENTDLRSLTVEMRNRLAAGDATAQALNERAQTLDTQAQMMNMQVIEQLRAADLLRSQLGEKNLALARAEQRLDELHAIVEQKNEHVDRLEQLLRQIESGRVLKLLRGAREAAQIARRAGPLAAARHAYSALRERALPIAIAPEQTPTSDPYQTWIAANEPGTSDLLRQHHAAQALAYRPLISIITPVYNPAPQVLQAAIESVRAQTYDHWNFCLVDGGSDALRVKALLSAYAQQDRRIQVQFLDGNQGISGNSNQALRMATGEFVVLLDHDDLLAPNLLYEIVKLLNQERDADIIYYDEDKISEDGAARNAPWFKPGRWSPDLLLSTNYLMHAAIRRALLLDVGGFDPQMDGAQDWDLALRLTEKTHKLGHIPRVLYHWRQVPGSAAHDANAKPWAYAAQERCIEAHLQRLGVTGARVVFPSLGRVRIRWPNSGAKVSIIIPTRDKVELLRACVTSILAQTSYPNYEIVLVDTGSAQPATHQYYDELASESRVRIIAQAGPFNYSLVNNLGARDAGGDVLLFLNNDTEALEADWLEELVGWAERPEVGIVGCKLIRPDRTIQHAGIVMGLAGHGSHIFDGDRENDYGPFGSPEWYRDYLAVTGACMAMRREVFERLGGFDGAYQVGYGDIDICLRAVEAGYRVVYTPFARVLHHEGGTRGFELPPSDVLRASMRMAAIIRAGDPFFNPNLSVFHRRPAIVQPDEEHCEDTLLTILKLFDLIDKHSLPFTDDRLEALAGTDEQPASERARRLALVTHELSLTGAPLILFKLAQYLAESGYAITVLSPMAGPMQQRYADAKIDVIVDPALLDDARAAFALLRDYDAVLANTILSWRVIYAAKAAETPSIWWVHESQFGQEQISRIPAIAGAFEAADIVLFPSKATAALYGEVATRDHCRIIHYGLDPVAQAPAMKAIHKQPDKFYVVNTASVERRKGQDALLRAIAVLPADVMRSMEFYLVGRVLDWRFYNELLHFAGRLQNVHLVGEVLHERALAYLQAADVYAFASRDEALPISVLEAMCYGKGIVTTNAGGVAEVIEDGVDGFVVDVDDHAALARALQRLFEDRELLGRMGANAGAAYQERLTMKRFGQDIVHLLDELTVQAPATAIPYA
jgi:O-antigen biosynthesis protein